MFDQIVKQIVLKAPRARVWAAISDSQQFGKWFGMAFDGPFVVGQPCTGKIMPTTVDPEVAKLQEPHAGTPASLAIAAIEPMTRFAFRWHPFAIDKSVDYSDEPMTLVEFVLADAPGGTQLTITESGFDGIPAARRAAAFAANAGGWQHQTVLLAKYLAL